MLAKILVAFLRIRQIQQTSARPSLSAERLFFTVLCLFEQVSSTLQQLNSTEDLESIYIHITTAMHSTPIFRMNIINRGQTLYLIFPGHLMFFSFTHCLHLEIVLCSRSLFFDLINVFTMIYFLFFLPKLSPISRFFSNFHFSLVTSVLETGLQLRPAELIQTFGDVELFPQIAPRISLRTKTRQNRQICEFFAFRHFDRFCATIFR